MGEARRRRLAIEKAGLVAPPEDTAPVHLKHFVVDGYIDASFDAAIADAYRVYVELLEVARAKGDPEAPTEPPTREAFCIFGLMHRGLQQFLQELADVQASQKLIVTPAEHAAAMRARR